jgi:hypothetical protein
VIAAGRAFTRPSQLPYFAPTDPSRQRALSRSGRGQTDECVGDQALARVGRDRQPD